MMLQIVLDVLQRLNLIWAESAVRVLYEVLLPEILSNKNIDPEHADLEVPSMRTGVGCVDLADNLLIQGKVDRSACASSQSCHAP